jgi:hypothetical protein
MVERGLSVDHTTIYRWVQHDAPELEKCCQPHLKATNDSWRVDETYVKVRGVWMYLYRSVDSQGNTLEFLLSATRDAPAAKRFLARKRLMPPTPRLPASSRSIKTQHIPKPFTRVGTNSYFSKTAKSKSLLYEHMRHARRA